MNYSQPFCPRANETYAVSVSAADVTVTFASYAPCVFIDNRSSDDDVFIAWDETPLTSGDTIGFPIPASTAQSFTMPENSCSVHLIRDSSAEAAVVYVTPGVGQ